MRNILESITNLINKNTITINKPINNTNSFLKLFQANIINSDYYYLIKIINSTELISEKVVYYLITSKSIEILDNSDVNFLKIIIKDDVNYNINKIIQKLVDIPNNELNNEKINLLKGTLFFMNDNGYYLNEINKMIEDELYNNFLDNKLIGGGIIDTIKSYNTSLIEILVSILATIPINQYVYNLLNLIMSILNGDKKGIGLTLVGFIPGYVGKLVKFANLIRLTYKYYNTKNDENNNESEEEHQ